MFLNIIIIRTITIPEKNSFVCLQRISHIYCSNLKKEAGFELLNYFSNLYCNPSIRLLHCVQLFLFYSFQFPNFNEYVFTYYRLRISWTHLILSRSSSSMTYFNESVKGNVSFFCNRQNILKTRVLLLIHIFDTPSAFSIIFMIVKISVKVFFLFLKR